MRPRHVARTRGPGQAHRRPPIEFVDVALAALVAIPHGSNIPRSSLDQSSVDEARVTGVIFPKSLYDRLRYSYGTPGESVAFIGLATLAVAGGVGVIGWPDSVPVALLAVPLLAGGFLLPPPLLRVIAGLVVVCLVVVSMAHGVAGAFLPETFVVVFTAVVAGGLARSRARLGVHGTMGESLLVDLRDRLAAQSKRPDLPSGWDLQSAQRVGGRTAFSGDFIVFAESPEGDLLEVVVVDVSGKGYEAGARALQLSGAFGALLGSVAPDAFLSAANAYLLRQHWPEGFATAVHLVVDLRIGTYDVRSAGHPPTIHYHAGSGLWETLDATGTLLGVTDDASYVPTTGQVSRGDAMLLYTDGVVEMRRRGLADGIDKLKGEAERLVARNRMERGAEALIEAMGRSESDDRALVLLRRT